MLKVGVSGVLLYFVFRKIPFSEIGKLIKTSNPLFLILALGVFGLSQMISSQRLLLYFHAQNFLIHKTDNFKLYLLGMFYNFFIPGGVGGDAYKIYTLHKKFRWNIKKLTKSVFCDRISGLFAIILLIEGLMTMMLSGALKLLIIPIVITTIFLARLFFRTYFPQFKNIFYQTLLYSLSVQVLQLVSVYFILKSLMQVDGMVLYFVVFLISSTLSIISFSGIGVREWLFMKAAQYFTFNPDISVSAAVLFSFITAIVAFAGLCFYHFKYKTDTYSS
ncbi:lysylphosphatidylglycerol synthetase [Chryseobacterium lactis]|uniref:Lysylphosphatidylglycerol synthetase n=2 Tax=Chryseobacterium lactis TaxID=1241981 RepID=A0A3G6RKM2_CHRLC|nr:UPF0104 family protein [Chryseobacterium lactis]AZB05511.1 UPF0104 family protein [Chryseobacterium lactis]PNW11354.1 lysylphosphatidylglycerol synthetase [Chryseobacterium lactis]